LHQWPKESSIQSQDTPGRCRPSYHPPSVSTEGHTMNHTIFFRPFPPQVSICRKAFTAVFSLSLRNQMETPSPSFTPGRITSEIEAPSFPLQLSPVCREIEFFKAGNLVSPECFFSPPVPPWAGIRRPSGRPPAGKKGTP